MSEEGVLEGEWPSLDIDATSGLEADLDALGDLEDFFGPEFDDLMREFESLDMDGFE